MSNGIGAVECPTCGGTPETEYGAAGFFITSCAECADGAPDAEPQPYGIGRSKGESVEAWNRSVQEYEL